MARMALAAAAVLALLAGGAAVAAPAPAPAGATPAAKPCAKEAKRLATFRKGMAKAKRRFFRAHPAKKARRAFVRRQAKRLKALRRAHRRCLDRSRPGGPTPTPTPTPTPSPTAPPTPAPQPGGLSGAPGDEALLAVADVVTDDALVGENEVSGGVVRTQVQLLFDRDATVGEVNGLLARIGGRIVSARRGVLAVVAEVPDPGSVDALDTLVESLRDDPAVRAALPVFIPPEDDLPEHIAPADVAAFVRSQAAVRAPAAWNARAGLAGRTPPSLVVADHFGDGAPGAGTDITLAAGSIANNARTSDHGYMVLGITSGTYDAGGVGSVGDEAVTGMFPGRLSVRAADITEGLAGAVLHDRMLELVETAPGDVVLNTSLGGWPCETLEDAQRYCTEPFAALAGSIWAEKVRGTDPGATGTNLEGRFLHATSAGNIEAVTGAVGARVNSEWAAATLLPLEDPQSGIGIPNLSNTLVVENFTATTTEPFEPGCIAPSSEFGGTIGGVGSPVHSFSSPGGSRTFADGGTSAATPQVAGLAAYVWTFAPGLSPAQLAGLLERTARPPDCGGTPVIDAYAALLAADDGVAALPVRRAILDIVDGNGDPGADGRFDGQDLDAFLAGFEARRGEIDYSRLDLNGDGVTLAEPGVARPGPVDLDADGARGEITHVVEGLTVHFDERSVTDENVLCHAAYSSLWQGPPDQRTADLGIDGCVGFGLSHTFPNQVQAGQANTLTVSATAGAIADTLGDPMGIEDVHLELVPSPGVTLGSASGTTNADGVFATTATVAQGQTALSIDVTAFDRPGGAVLATDTVSAQVLLPGTATIDAVTGEVTVNAGGPGANNHFADSSGGWSLSGSDAGPGGASVSASATASLTTVGSTLHYTGTGELTATSGGGGYVASYVTVTVSGGPVRWSLSQRVTGDWPPGPFLGGCSVNFQFTGDRGGTRGGVLDPGTHDLSHSCGAGADSTFPNVDGDIEWTLTIGP